MLLDQADRQGRPAAAAGRSTRRIPRDLETIVLKAIEKEPGRRYPTAADMADDLRRFLADRPIQARRASWREQAWRWCRRNPGVAALAVGRVRVPGAAGRRAVGRRRLVWQAKRDVEAAKCEVETTLAEEKQAAYFQRIALADRELAANNLARAEELLALCPAELRGWEWHYLNRSRGRIAEAALATRGRSRAGGRAQPGRAAARDRRARDGTVTVWDLAAGQPARRSRPTPDAARAGRVQPGRAATWSPPTSPDGRPTGEVKFWDPPTGAAPPTAGSTRPGPSHALAFSPDGRRLGHRDLPEGGSKECASDVRDGRPAAPGRSPAGARRTPSGAGVQPGRPARWRPPATTGSSGCRDSHTGRAVHVFRRRPAGAAPVLVRRLQPGRPAAGGRVRERAGASGRGRAGVGRGRPGASDRRPARPRRPRLAFGPGRAAGHRRARRHGSRSGTPTAGRSCSPSAGTPTWSDASAFTPDGHRLVTRPVRTAWSGSGTPPRCGTGSTCGDEWLTLAGHTNGVKAAGLPTRPGRWLASGERGRHRPALGRRGPGPRRAGRCPTGDEHRGRPSARRATRLAVGGRDRRPSVSGPGPATGGRRSSPRRLARGRLAAPAGVQPGRARRWPGATRAGTVLVWDAATGRRPPARRARPCAVTGVAFGPDPAGDRCSPRRARAGRCGVWDPTTGGPVRRRSSTRRRPRWRSARTAAGWPPPGGTRSSGSGTRRRPWKLAEPYPRPDRRAEQRRVQPGRQAARLGRDRRDGEGVAAGDRRGRDPPGPPELGLGRGVQPGRRRDRLGQPGRDGEGLEEARSSRSDRADPRQPRRRRSCPPSPRPTAAGSR